MMKKTLSNKEKRQLNESLLGYNFQFGKKDNVEIVEDKHKLIRLNNEAVFFYSDGCIVPSLRPVLDGKVMLKKITVDMGAVKFVVNGADIMRPGIVDIDDGIKKDEAVVIVDENNKKPLAIGKALFSSEEMMSKDSGKVVRTVHFVGDGIWNG